MNFERDSFSGEIPSSPQLRDEALAHLPEVAIERQLDVVVRYHLSTFRFIEISYNPNEEDADDRLMIDLVDAAATPGAPDIDATTDEPTVHEPECNGTLKRCWMDPATGEIDVYIDCTGKLIDGVTFVPDTLFEQSSNAFGVPGLDLPTTPEEETVAELNHNFEVFTQDKLDVILGAFTELDSREK